MTTVGAIPTLPTRVYQLIYLSKNYTIMALFDYKQEKANGYEYLSLYLSNGQEVAGEFFDATALKNLPNGKYDYYLRHADDDWAEPIGIKRDKGLTVNFMGTLVLDKPLEFADNEIEVVEYGYGELF